MKKKANEEVWRKLKGKVLISVSFNLIKFSLLPLYVCVYKKFQLQAFLVERICILIKVQQLI
jgi:hypothetical protein